MDVKTLCLGILSFGEASGYDIKKYLDQTFAHFFAAGYGSIYPALADLAESGHVECRDEPQEGRPDRKVYRLTEAGETRFREVILETEPRHKVRSEFLAVLFFAHHLPPERLDEVLDHQLATFEESVECLRFLEDANAACELPPGVRFVGGFGLHMAKAARDYVRDNRHLLEVEETPRTPTRRAAGTQR